MGLASVGPSAWSSSWGETALVLCPAVTGVGFVLLTVSGHITNYWTGLLPELIIVGIGMTLSVAPLTTTVFDSVPAAKSGVASGINNAAARVGSLLAVAALGLAFGGGTASLQVPHWWMRIVLSCSPLPPLLR